MTVNLSLVGGASSQFFSNNGNPLSGGLIYTYIAGTTTPTSTYTTIAGNIAHSNPIVLDAAGRVPTGEIWLVDGISYKFVIKDANNVLIGTYDNIKNITDANQIYYTAPFSNSVEQTVEEKLSQTVSPKDFGAVADGVTDDAAAIQYALNSGYVVDGSGYSYAIGSSVTIGANRTLQNIKLIAKNSGINMVLVNTASKLLNVTLVGSGTTSIVERGVYPAADSVTDVIIDNVNISNITYGIHAQYISNSSTRPERWRITGNIYDIVGTTASSEGYGVLLSPANNCYVNVSFKNIKRHALYISAGASYNEGDISVDGCGNYAVQIYATGSQPHCVNNIVRGTFKNLTEDVATQSGAVALVGLVDYNDISISMTGNGSTKQAIWFEGTGTPTGPYPKNNAIHDCVLTGSYTDSVINVVYCENTSVLNNSINGLWPNGAAITMNGSSTITVTNGGTVLNNTINGNGTSYRGITNTYEVPIFIGTNNIQGVTTNRVLDASVQKKRIGFSRQYAGLLSVSNVPATSTADGSITLPDELENPYGFATVNGGSVTSVNVPLTAAIQIPTGTSSIVRVYNGAAATQDIDVYWTYVGD